MFVRVLRTMGKFTPRCKTPIKKNSQIQRVEEQHNVFALVVREFDVDKVTVEHSLRCEVRCWFADERLRHLEKSLDIRQGGKLVRVGHKRAVQVAPQSLLISI